MDYNIPIELEIRLKINDFSDKDIGDKIFKPKHVDEKLGDKIYLTDKYELLPENLEKAGFKNDQDEHRSLLSSKTKMRQFLVSMQNDDRDAKGARYAKESIEELKKKIAENDNEELNNDLEELKKKKKNFIKKIGDNKPTNEIIKTNLKFVLKAFFKKNSNIKISPNNFVIYSSGIGEGVLEDKKDSSQSTKNDLINKTTTFNIKIIDGKDKVSRLDLAKVGCKERAERIEKDVFELLGISVDLFQNSTAYNPVNIFNKLREDSTKKDAKKDERVRAIEVELRERRANKEAKKIVRDKLKKEKIKLKTRKKDGTIDDDDGNSDSDDSDDDYDDDANNDPDREKKLNIMLKNEKRRVKEKKENEKEKKKENEKEKKKKNKKENEKEKKKKNKKENEKEKKMEQKDGNQVGGYKYKTVKSRETRRKISHHNNKKTRRKY